MSWGCTKWNGGRDHEVQLWLSPQLDKCAQVTGKTVFMLHTKATKEKERTGLNKETGFFQSTSPLCISFHRDLGYLDKKTSSGPIKLSV